MCSIDEHWETPFIFKNDNDNNHKNDDNDKINN